MRTKPEIQHHPRSFKSLEPDKKNEVRFSPPTVAFAAALLFSPFVGWAGGVVTNCTESDLRNAMAGGGTVTFACDGTITLANTITNESDTVLDASGHQVSISGGNAVRALFVNTNTALTLVNLTMANGRSDKGGAIFDEGFLNAINCLFSDNVVSNGDFHGNLPMISSGGAIYNAGTAVVSGCTFLHNQAMGVTYPGPAPEGGQGRGGAICNIGVLRVDGSLFVSNEAIGLWGKRGQDWLGTSGSPGASGFGGALFNGGVVTLVNSTISSNNCIGGAGGWGGDGPYSMAGVERVYLGPGGNGGAGGSGLGSGIYSDGYPAMLTNCTVAFNSATGGMGGYGGGGSPPGGTGANGTAGGAIHLSAGSLLINDIVAANSPSNCSGILSDLGHNLSSDSSGGFTNSTSLTNTNPKLGLLTDNGGPTPTIALLSGSPAIDAGDTAAAPPTDQRGFPRPAGAAADIGAFEYGSMLPVLAVSRIDTVRLDITAYGNMGQSCRLLTSTDLLNWIPIATNQLSGDGTVVFHDNYNPGIARMFYRLAMP